MADYTTEEVDTILKQRAQLIDNVPMRIDRCLRNWLEENFHPMMARYQYMEYVVAASNQNISDGFLDASSDAQIAEHIASYGQGGKLRLKSNSSISSLIHRLISQVQLLVRPISELVEILLTLIRGFIDAQDDLTYRLSGDKKAYLSGVLTDQLARLNLKGNEGFMSNHSQYLSELMGPGSKILNALQPFAHALNIELFDNNMNGGPHAGTGIMWKHDPFSDESWGQDAVFNLDNEKGVLDALPDALRKICTELFFFNDIDRCFSKITLEALGMNDQEGVKLVIRQAFGQFMARVKEIPEHQYGSILSSFSAYNIVQGDGYKMIIQLDQMQDRWEQAYEIDDDNEKLGHERRMRERDEQAAAEKRAQVGSTDHPVGEADHPKLAVTKQVALVKQGGGKLVAVVKEGGTKAAKVKSPIPAPRTGYPWYSGLRWWPFWFSITNHRQASMLAQ